MNEKELINEVILEIKRRFGERILSDEPAVKSFDQASKKTAAVIGNMSNEEEKIFQSLYTKVSWMDKKDYDILMISSLSIRVMVEIVLGLPGCPESAEILDAMIKGRKVCVLENGIEYKKYKCTAVKTLYHLYQEYEEKMMRLGILPISHLLEIPKNNWREPPCENNQGNCLNLTNQRLIRESDLMKAKTKGCITVTIDSHAIITPLAVDYLSNHDLQIRRNKR